MTQGGYISFYNLDEWWQETFTAEEQRHIEGVYQPLGGDIATLTSGSIGSSSQTAAQFLGALASWFLTGEQRVIGRKIGQKAILLADPEKRPVETHFILQRLIQLHYPDRKDPQMMESAIRCCLAQIAIQGEVKQQMLADSPDQPLPSHTGFKQLAIIREKEGDFEAAIELSESALLNGWAGDWEKRIERCRKKL